LDFFLGQARFDDLVDALCQGFCLFVKPLLAHVRVLRGQASG